MKQWFNRSQDRGHQPRSSQARNWRSMLFRFSIKLLMFLGVIASLLAAYAANVWHERQTEVAYLEALLPKLKVPVDLNDQATAVSTLTGLIIF